MILDITVSLNEAELALRDPSALDRARCLRLRDGLLRNARNPMVMGDQRAAGLRLAEQLSARLDG